MQSLSERYGFPIPDTLDERPSSYGVPTPDSVFGPADPAVIELAEKIIEEHREVLRALARR